jgi:hypothetical protein
MTVLKLNDIEKLYSEKVASLIMAGYVISSEHTSGSQTSEVSTISLTNNNGKTVIRVGLIEKFADWGKRELKLVVLKFENVGWGTLWNHKAEVLEEKTFFEVNREKKIYCESKIDLDKILSLRKERFENRKCNNRIYDKEIIESEKAINIIWKIVRKKDGYKSVPKKRIVRVLKDQYGYMVYVDNRPNLRIRLGKEA